VSSSTQRVVKHNDLVKARSNLSKVEHRVIAMLIAQLDREDETFDLQRIHIRDIIEKSGSSSQDRMDAASMRGITRSIRFVMWRGAGTSRHDSTTA
jgi:hypothetical protein